MPRKLSHKAKVVKFVSTSELAELLLQCLSGIALLMKHSERLESQVENISCEVQNNKCNCK